MTDTKKSEQQKVDKAPKHVYKYESKPIAKSGRECLYTCQEIVAKTSRLYKYQIGTGLINTASQLVYAIYDALDYVGFNEDKVKKINIVLECLRRLVIIIRVMKDLNQISQDMFEKSILQLVSMKTQILNWLNFVNEKIKEASEKDKDETTNK